MIRAAHHRHAHSPKKQRSRNAVEARSLYENQSLWSELQEMCYAPPKAAPPAVLSALQTLDQHMSLASLTSSSSSAHLIFGVEKAVLSDVLGPAKARAEVRLSVAHLVRSDFPLPLSKLHNCRLF